MNTNRQRFTNDRTTVRALLACVPWVNKYHLTTGTFSLVDQEPNELSPARVGDSSRKPAVLDHPFDAQVFHSDCAESVDQRSRNLVVRIFSSISNFCVQRRYTLFDLLPPIASFVAARQLTLPSSQLGEPTLHDSSVTVDLPFGVDCEVRQPEIKTSRSIVSSGRRVGKFDCEGDVPPPVLTNDRSYFERSVRRNLPVPPHSDRTDVLESQFAVDDFYTTAVPRHCVREGIEAIDALKSRVSRFFTVFASPVEVLKRLVKSTECLLCRPEVQTGKEFVSVSFNFEPPTLLRPSPIYFVLLPDKGLRLQTSVVQPAVCFEAHPQLSLLRSVGKQTVFEGAKQLLAFLIFNVFTNGCFGNRTDGTREVASRPERRNPCSQDGIPASQNSRSVSLQSIDNLCHTNRRVGFHEQMNVIGHYFERVNLHIDFFSFLVKKGFEVGFNVVSQNVTTPLRAPNDVVFEAEDCTGIFRVSTHTMIIQTTFA